MHKAFQHVDLDKSGTLERSEIARMCDGWNINVLNVDELLRHCDTNGDGVLNYHEFVDAFAQDTVQRGTWHAGDTQMRTAVTPEHVNAAAGVFGLKAPRRFGEPMRPINCAQGISGHLSDRALLFAVRERVKQRYTGPRKAFQHLSTRDGGCNCALEPASEVRSGQCTSVQMRYQQRRRPLLSRVPQRLLRMIG